MGMIPLDIIEVGMVTGRDVTDRNGRMLLGAGAELTAKHLTIFRTWGIEEVDIVGAEVVDEKAQLPPDVAPEDLTEVEQSLEPLFRYAGMEHPVIKELLRLTALRKVRQEHG